MMYDRDGDEWCQARGQFFLRGNPNPVVLTVVLPRQASIHITSYSSLTLDLVLGSPPLWGY